MNQVSVAQAKNEELLGVPRPGQSVVMLVFVGVLFVQQEGVQPLAYPAEHQSTEP